MERLDTIRVTEDQEHDHAISKVHAEQHEHHRAHDALNPNRDNIYVQYAHRFDFVLVTVTASFAESQRRYFVVLLTVEC